MLTTPLSEPARVASLFPMLLLWIVRKPSMIPTSESLQIKPHLLIEYGVWGAHAFALTHKMPSHHPALSCALAAEIASLRCR